jgi:hypothetical protein
MTRKVIATEGIPSAIPDTWLAPGSLQVNDARLPVTRGFDFTDTSDLVGWATDMQRDNETGEITVDISYLKATLEDNMNDDEYDYAFYASNLVVQQVEATDEVPEHRLILSARLRSITIVPIAAIPKAFSRNSSQNLQGT